MKIEGSVALVTGANRGIGRAIAGELLARGATKVYAGVRDPSTVTDDRLVPVALDVTDADQVARAAQQLDDVQIVVNNAGIGGGSTPLGADLDAARAELEVNYLGLVSVTQAFAPVLAAHGGGAFVNVLSVVSWAASPSLTTYSASKAAAWSFTNAARIELAPWAPRSSASTSGSSTPTSPPPSPSTRSRPRRSLPRRWTPWSRASPKPSSTT